MITRDEKKLLLDILNSIENLDFHLERKRNLDDYLNNLTNKKKGS